MTSVLEQLQELQQSICDTNAPDASPEHTEKLYFLQSHGLFHIEFYGVPGEAAYTECLHVLCAADVAAQLCSITLRGPDEGANGTRNWDLTAMVEAGTEFPHLKAFFVESMSPEHHNQSIIGADYEEAGQISHLLVKMPAIESLTVPSAPDAGFFQRGTRPLSFLRVESGYDHQNFILNLGHSDCFPGLRMLDFGDFSQRYMDDYQQHCTPFNHYEQLFQSQAFTSVRGFNLRNSVLSADQLARLRRLRPKVQFYVVQTYGEYIR
ncbi:MAG: hypothetical protein JO250_09980 [Armatimonadetes bacterium]|nr:hypothetical protein [Armatimonadota bacterium]